MIDRILKQGSPTTLLDHSPTNDSRTNSFRLLVIKLFRQQDKLMGAIPTKDLSTFDKSARYFFQTVSIIERTTTTMMSSFKEIELYSAAPTR